MLLVRGGDFLLTAECSREGSDLLLVGSDGTSVLIQDYFALEVPPALVTEGGAMVPPDPAARLAGPQAPGQYVETEPSHLAPGGRRDAQATAPPAAHPAGARGPFPNLW